MQDVQSYYAEHRGRFLEELTSFLSIPSISTSEERAGDLLSAAEFVRRQLENAGMQNVALHPTKGNPVVYGEWLGAKGKPTVLIYGHYDVQPPEPLELWDTPPFEPTVRDGKIFARGSADDKGQVFIHLKAVEAFMKTRRSLPVNVKFCIEGEEEVGSTNLADFVRDHKQMLACDVILISDTHMMSVKQPSITYGLRGLTYLEIGVTAAKGDMHSGTFGGGVANPIQVLAEILMKCKDAKSGKVTIPGFYDDVVPITKKERAELAKLPHSDAKWLREIGARKTFGEKGYTTIERTGCRPTFEVNGIWGGYTGGGVKTVLPAEAHAKVSMRLVANQDPSKIARLFRKHIAAVAPDTVKVSVTLFDNNGYPALTPIESEGMRAAAAAIRKVYGKSPYYTREGGSIPVVADFQHILGVDAVLLGFGLPDDNLHAPNEKFDLVQLDKGLSTVAAFFTEIAGSAS